MLPILHSFVEPLKGQRNHRHKISHLSQRHYTTTWPHHHQSAQNKPNGYWVFSSSVWSQQWRPMSNEAYNQKQPWFFLCAFSIEICLHLWTDISLI